MVTRAQLTKLVYERNQGRSIIMSAQKSGMSRNTARNHLRQDDVLKQEKVPHTWRTRKDPLEGIWPEALKMLREAPDLEAKALFDYLSQCHPGVLKPGLLRTFQRRVRSWRLAEGPEKEVFFTQDHTPGKVLAIDWTDMNQLNITIQGRTFEHKLFHAVLPFSNWEWAVRARSESTLSLRCGLKATLGRLGRVPLELLSDHSSTATHQLKRAGSERGFNEEYLGICAHYGIKPRTINVGRPQENGDCESSHGHLKRRIRQHLLLRGSRDFESEEKYDEFLSAVLESANELRAAKLGEELTAMPERAVPELPDFKEVMVSVGNNSTIRVRKLVYSVPSRLIGTKLLARIYENRIVLFAGAQEVARLPMRTGDSGAVIDFRHLIGHLVRKPGAFAGYRWREELFPAPAYRAAFDHLERRHPAEADRLYLKILKVASGEGQTVVENALEHLLAAPHPEVSAAAVGELLETWQDLEREWRERPPMEVDLGSYDELLESGRSGCRAQNNTTINKELAV
ncbi:IS21 family transposase [Verrucomicrobiaceae bacterium 227]